METFVQAGSWTIGFDSIIYFSLNHYKWKLTFDIGIQHLEFPNEIITIIYQSLFEYWWHYCRMYKMKNLVLHSPLLWLCEFEHVHFDSLHGYARRRLSYPHSERASQSSPNLSMESVPHCNKSRKISNIKNLQYIVQWFRGPFRSHVTSIF